MDEPMNKKIDIALAVVLRDKKVLIQHRFRKKAGFVYEFPGGSIDAGETPEEAASRELWEETGLKTTDIIDKFCYENSTGGNAFFVLFKIAPDSSPAEVSKTRQQTFYWFGFNEIPQDNFHKCDIKFIKNDLRKFI